MTEIPDAETINAFNKSIADEFRANDGKVTGPFENADLLLLTTTGAKSGQPRVSPLAYSASTASGSSWGPSRVPRSVRPGCTICGPAAVHIEVGAESGLESFDVTARELPPAERDELFAKVTAVAPGFAEYQTKTSRVIRCSSYTAPSRSSNLALAEVSKRHEHFAAYRGGRRRPRRRPAAAWRVVPDHSDIGCFGPGLVHRQRCARSSQPFSRRYRPRCALSISNVLRAQRAVQMMIGVSLGSGWRLIQSLLAPASSPSPSPFWSRCVSRWYRARLHRPGDDVRQPDRRFLDPGLGAVPERRRLRTHRRRPDRWWPRHRVRGVAVPANPLNVLRRARIAVLDALHGVAVPHGGVRRRAPGGRARLAAVSGGSGA